MRGHSLGSRHLAGTGGTGAGSGVVTSGPLPPERAVTFLLAHFLFLPARRTLGPPLLGPPEFLGHPEGQPRDTPGTPKDTPGTPRDIPGTPRDTSGTPQVPGELSWPRSLPAFGTMFCFPFRRKGRRGDPPEPPAPQTMDCGIFREPRAPEDSLGAAGPWQPAAEKFSVFCRHRRPGKGWGLRGARLWGQNGIRHSRGAGESWRDTGMPGEAGDAPRCAQVDGKEPGSCRNARVQEEKLTGMTPSGIQQLGKDIRDEPAVPRQARNGNVPRCAQVGGKAPELLEKLGTYRNAGGGKTQVENAPSGIQQLRKDIRDEAAVPRQARNGNVPREGADQPQPLPRAGSGEHEDGEACSRSQSLESCVERHTDAATAPGEDGHGQEPEPPSAAELRGWLQERLCQLGGDAESWEEKSTAALAADLAQRVLGVPTEKYPPEPGIWSIPRQQGPAASRHLQLCAAASVRGSAPGSDGRVIGMVWAPGNAERREEEVDSDSEENSEEEEEEEEEVEEVEEENSEVEEEEVEVEEENSEEVEEENSEVEEEDLEEASENSEGSDSEREQDVIPVRIYALRLCSALADEFPEVWARSRLDCGRVAEELRLDGAPVPFQRQRQKPRHVEERMAAFLREYLEQGIVVEGTSASNNPLILVRKPNGRGWRLTLHCRALSEATPAERPERLDKTSIVSAIGPRSRYFSVLDLSNASLAIPLARSCWPRFAFTFRGRQFLFTRLPPTFRGSGSVVHRRVGAMLARLQPATARGVFHYYDDILVAGKSQRQAERRTRRVLELIQETGFKANPWKSQLVQRQVNFLGVTIGAAGWEIPEAKVLEIGSDCDAPGPWNAGMLRSILGKFNYWQEFIPDYWELALPLQRLLGLGEREWERDWGWKLHQLREALEAAPVLRFPNKSRPFLIRLSPHAETAGATLLQEKAGILVPVRHCSRNLSRRNLSPPEMGCLAAVLAVRAFQAFTGPAPIVIQDSNGNYLIRGEALGSGGSRGSRRPERRPRHPEQWTLLLTSRGPEVQKSQSVSIPSAPPLGQLPSHIPKANVWFLAVESQEWAFGFAAANLEERWLMGACRKDSELDAELEALRELLEQHRSLSPLVLYSSCPALAARLERREMEPEPGRNSGKDSWRRVLRWLCAFPGMLEVRELRGASGTDEALEMAWIGRVSAQARTAAGQYWGLWKIWEPSKLERQEIVAQCHRQHDGVEPTLARVRKVASWQSEREDVAQWVLRCPKCRETHPNPDPNPDPGPQRAEGPWSCLRISLSKALPKCPAGFGALLVAQDALSGWVDAFPLRERAEPEVTATLLREVFGRFGKVGSVLLAPAPAWMWDSLHQAPLRDFWSRLERSEPHAAASCLWKVAQAAGARWAEELPLILAGIRSRWVREAELGPLLCVPGLPLELRWELPGRERPGPGNELQRLSGTWAVPRYRERVEAALGGKRERDEPDSGLYIGYLPLRPMDPGSELGTGLRDLGSWGLERLELALRDSRSWDWDGFGLGPGGVLD